MSSTGAPNRTPKIAKAKTAKTKLSALAKVEQKVDSGDEVATPQPQWDRLTTEEVRKEEKWTRITSEEFQMEEQVPNTRLTKVKLAVAAAIGSVKTRVVGIVKRTATPVLARTLHYVPAPVKKRVTALGTSAHATVTNPKVQVTAVGAAGGAATGGASGAVMGLTGGAMAGAMAGMPLALFTFGLSIPVMATFGGAAGCCVGATVGSSAGLVGGAAVGGAYASKKEIGDAVNKATTTVSKRASGAHNGLCQRAADYKGFVEEKVANSTGFVKERTAASKGFLQEKVVLLKGKFSSGTGSTI